MSDLNDSTMLRHSIHSQSHSHSHSHSQSHSPHSNSPLAFATPLIQNQNQIQIQNPIHHPSHLTSHTSPTPQVSSLSRLRTLQSDSLSHSHSHSSANSHTLDGGEMKKLELQQAGKSVNGVTESDEAISFPPVQDSALCVFCDSDIDLLGEENVLFIGPFHSLNSVTESDSSNSYAHANCIKWTPGAVINDAGQVTNIDELLPRRQNCSECKKKGATLLCHAPGCRLCFHFPCAVKVNCSFVGDFSHLYCFAHVELGLLDNSRLDNIYKVERILGQRVVKKKYQYLIKWQGYENKDCTWETEEAIMDKSVIEAWNREQMGKKQTPKQKSIETSEEGNNLNTSNEPMKNSESDAPLESNKPRKPRKQTTNELAQLAFWRVRDAGGNKPVTGGLRSGGRRQSADAAAAPVSVIERKPSRKSLGNANAAATKQQIQKIIVKSIESPKIKQAQDKPSPIAVKIPPPRFESKSPLPASNPVEIIKFSAEENSLSQSISHSSPLSSPAPVVASAPPATAIESQPVVSKIVIDSDIDSEIIELSNDEFDESLNNHRQQMQNIIPTEKEFNDYSNPKKSAPSANIEIRHPAMHSESIDHSTMEFSDSFEPNPLELLISVSEITPKLPENSRSAVRVRKPTNKYAQRFAEAEYESADQTESGSGSDSGSQSSQFEDVQQRKKKRQQHRMQPIDLRKLKKHKPDSPSPIISNNGKHGSSLSSNTKNVGSNDHKEIPKHRVPKAITMRPIEQNQFSQQNQKPTTEPKFTYPPMTMQNSPPPSGYGFEYPGPHTPSYYPSVSPSPYMWPPVSPPIPTQKIGSLTISPTFPSVEAMKSSQYTDVQIDFIVSAQRELAAVYSQSIFHAQQFAQQQQAAYYQSQVAAPFQPQSPYYYPPHPMQFAPPQNDPYSVQPPQAGYYMSPSNPQYSPYYPQPLQQPIQLSHAVPHPITQPPQMPIPPPAFIPNAVYHHPIHTAIDPATGQPNHYQTNQIQPMPMPQQSFATLPVAQSPSLAAANSDPSSSPGGSARSAVSNANFQFPAGVVQQEIQRSQQRDERSQTSAASQN